ncbi:MAG: class I SAM-dependent methyltransferase, partial [Lysobacteraceae bacterium]
MRANLPQPDADARAHSALLRDVIAEQVIVAGGSLPFWKFMELALYAPGLGYYSAGAHKFGPDGDFTTAPELSPLFSACVADALTPVLQQLGPEAVFVEVGGGSGAFAETCLAKLLANDALPARYAILEPSADLRQRQRDRLQQRLPPLLFELVEWLDGPIQDEWNGVLFANEVIDALPSPRFTIRDGEVF